MYDKCVNPDQLLNEHCGLDLHYFLNLSCPSIYDLYSNQMCQNSRGNSLYTVDLTLYLPSKTKSVFLSKSAHTKLIVSIQILVIHNLRVKKLENLKRRPPFLWGLIWVQIVCIGYQQSSKVTASRQRGNKMSLPNS